MYGDMTHPEPCTCGDPDCPDCGRYYPLLDDDDEYPSPWLDDESSEADE